MFWRDVPSWALEFWLYDSILKANPGLTGASEFFWVVNAGGIAGLIAVGIGLPQDIVKTKQMTHEGAKPLKASKALKELIEEGGLSRVFRGSGPSLARGYVMDMISLPLFEVLTNWLR